MYDLKVHRHCAEDLKELDDSDPEVSAKIKVHLQELRGDQAKLHSLLDRNQGKAPEDRYDIDWWWTQYKRGRDLWRTKLKSIEHRRDKYRVLYAYFPRTRTFIFLAIAPRSFNYDAEHEISKRVIDDYEKLKDCW